VEKYGDIHAYLGLKDPAGIAVKHWLILVMIPAFMLGIWHEGDWMKEIFGLINLWSGCMWKSHT